MRIGKDARNEYLKTDAGVNLHSSSIAHFQVEAAKTYLVTADGSLLIFFIRLIRLIKNGCFEI